MKFQKDQILVFQKNYVCEDPSKSNFVDKKRIFIIWLYLRLNPIVWSHALVQNYHFEEIFSNS